MDDQVQPKYLSSLIRVIAVCLLEAFFLRTVATVRAGWIPKLSRVFAGRKCLLLVVFGCDSFVIRFELKRQ